MVRCWSKVVCNTMKSESSFGITANNLFFFFSLLPLGRLWGLLYLFLYFFPVILDVTETGCSQSWTPTAWEGFTPTSAWPWVRGTSESKSGAAQITRYSSKLHQPPEHNLGWVSVGVGWFAARLFLGDSAWKNKFAQKIIAVIFLCRTEGEGWGEACGRQQTCIAHLFLSSNIPELFKTVFIPWDVYVFLLNMGIQRVWGYMILVKKKMTAIVLSTLSSFSTNALTPFFFRLFVAS